MWIKISLTGQWQNSVCKLTTDLFWGEEPISLWHWIKLYSLSKMFPPPARCNTSSRTQPLCSGHDTAKRFSRKLRVWVGEKQPLPLVEAFICLTPPLLFTQFFPCSSSFPCCFLLPAAAQRCFPRWPWREQGLVDAGVLQPCLLSGAARRSLRSRTGSLVLLNLLHHPGQVLRLVALRVGIGP